MTIHPPRSFALATLTLTLPVPISVASGGTVTIAATNNAGYNAVIAGIFLN